MALFEKGGERWEKKPQLHHPSHPHPLFPRHSETDKPCNLCGCVISREEDVYVCLHPRCDFRIHERCNRDLYYEDGSRVPRVYHQHELAAFSAKEGKQFRGCRNCKSDLSSGEHIGCKTCEVFYHRNCVKFPETLQYPLHPDHDALVLFISPRDDQVTCQSCGIDDRKELCYRCTDCDFTLHARCGLHIILYQEEGRAVSEMHIGCSSQFPTQKHYLHEHGLIRMDRIPSLHCNRCGTSMNSPFLRCVPCNFNLHKKCTGLPGVVKHKTHYHPLTLRDSFMEDDTGEYYCDLCGERRDGRLGVYMCLQCKMEQPLVFHIECVLPELRGVNVKKVSDSVLKKSNEEVAKKEGQLLALEKKLEETKRELEETKRELEELRKKNAELYLLKAQGEEE